jgi:hypothetical protein
MGGNAPYRTPDIKLCLYPIVAILDTIAVGWPLHLLWHKTATRYGSNPNISKRRKPFRTAARL